MELIPRFRAECHRQNGCEGRFIFQQAYDLQAG